MSDSGRAISDGHESWQEKSERLAAECDSLRTKLDIDAAVHRAVLRQLDAERQETNRQCALKMQAIRQLSALKSAACDIYIAGRWTCDVPPDVQSRLWEALRDAAGIAKGTATKIGMGGP
jgi:hypothetical protein